MQEYLIIQLEWKSCLEMIIPLVTSNVPENIKRIISFSILENFLSYSFTLLNQLKTITFVIQIKIIFVITLLALTKCNVKENMRPLQKEVNTFKFEIQS